MRSPKIVLLFTLVALPLSAREFDIRPAPPWVEHLTADAGAAVARQNVRWGIYDLLRDHQVRVAANGVESSYRRTVRQVLTPSAVQNASELSLDFDPSYQRLTLHEVSIIRNGVRRQAFDPAAVRVIDKEDDADESIYDGERTALVFIKDVRPGDVLDYSWSVDGGNPLLDDRYTDGFDLSSTVPTRRLRHRLVWPAARRLQWRGAQPVVISQGDEHVLVWERRDVRALDVEDELPSWYEAGESVQVSEYASWNEVARWADTLFQLDPRSYDAVKQLAARIIGEHATRDERITAAIRFVQDDVRYLGIEMGRNSHEPHQPSVTLEQRWGDCKDKAFLLAALLRELGVEAHPALVNTRLRRHLADRLPSPFLFDHVIVQVVDAGRFYWVDGTISDQGGTLQTLETPDLERALVVRPDTTGLTTIVTNERGATLVEQTYTTTDYAKPTRLEVRTTVSGGDADSLRSDLAAYSLEDFAHDRINDLAADQPRITADGLPSIHDDRRKNVITVVEKYRLPDLWKDGSWTWYPSAVEEHLQRPDTMIRKMPLAFERPLDVRQVVTFNFPEDVTVTKRTSVTETTAFRYEASADSNGHTVQLKRTLRAKRDFVDVQDVPEYLTKLNAIWSEIGYELSPNGASAPEPDAPAAADDTTKWAVGVVMVLLFVAVAVFLAWRHRTPAAPLLAGPAFQPGDAPASALAVSDHDDLDAHLGARGCRCGARLPESGEVQRARYGESDMTIVTRRCGVCGSEQSLYFTGVRASA
ncbi:MAG TPA: DUF3857 and transglutaminase domain-containing protein [Thermoanaerobaculia bacterium]